jgi:hypothetical protein
MSRPRSKEINDAACTRCTRFITVSSTVRKTLAVFRLKYFPKTTPAKQVPFLKQPVSGLRGPSDSFLLDKIFKIKLKYLKYLIICINLFDSRMYG